MRSLRRVMSLLMFLVISGALVYGEVVSYTFTGATGVAGTDWTLVSPSGYIPNDTNVVGLLTTSTDFMSLGVDYGPLIGIGDAGEQSGNVHCTDAGTPCFEINMGIVNPFGPGTYLIPFYFAGTDGTSGTFTEIQTGSTLTIGAVPEPGFAALGMLGAGLLALRLLMRRRGARGLS